MVDLFVKIKGTFMEEKYFWKLYSIQILVFSLTATKAKVYWLFPVTKRVGERLEQLLNAMRKNEKLRKKLQRGGVVRETRACRYMGKVPLKPLDIIVLRCSMGCKGTFDWGGMPASRTAVRWIVVSSLKVKNSDKEMNISCKEFI